MYEAGNDHGFRVHKVEPRFDEWAAHGQPIAGFLGLLKTVPGVVNWTKIVHVLWLELCGIVMSSSELICMLVD